MSSFWNGFEKRAGTRWSKELIKAFGQSHGASDLTLSKMLSSAANSSKKNPWKRGGTLTEIREALRKNHGVRVGHRTVEDLEGARKKFKRAYRPAEAGENLKQRSTKFKTKEGKKKYEKLLARLRKTGSL